MALADKVKANPKRLYVFGQKSNLGKIESIKDLQNDLCVEMLHLCSLSVFALEKTWM